MITVAILTISDSRTKENDISGKTIQDILPSDIYSIVDYSLVKDEKGDIVEYLTMVCDEKKVNLVFTNGGTGFGLRDVTPEATQAVIEKNVPGLSEYMRIEGLKHTQKSVLSRGVSGIRGDSLIINLPGSPKGVEQSLSAILPLLEHAVAMMHGESH